MANQLKAIKILSELVKEISESSDYHVNISLNKAHLIGYLEAIEELEILLEKDKKKNCEECYNKTSLVLETLNNKGCDNCIYNKIDTVNYCKNCSRYYHDFWEK